MALSLLVLAAGMGSRYGGLKQIDPVGPNGETIIDYSVYDALRAGFDRLVFVIRRDIERPFKETIGRRFEGRIAVDYVFQELDKLPPGFQVPSDRKKPWGTGHAILVAAEAIQEPVGVINGDDFYGARSFQSLAAHLRADSTTYAMVGYVLRNTLSEFGSVSRGVCEVTPDGFLKSVTELTKIEKDGSNVRNIQSDGRIQPLTGQEIVSMNIWGFTPSLFNHLRYQFERFLSQRGQDEKAEFYIPTVVNQLIADGQEQVKVLRTPDAWFGITYREDSPRVTESIRRLAAQGDYPQKL
jgi:NDP-sugar pyrophosphorylase family protein